jgi:hypothetical protein
MEEFKNILADEIIKYAKKIGIGDITEEEALEYIGTELEITEVIFAAARRWHRRVEELQKSGHKG